MLATYRGAHAGAAVAVLGSGPTLEHFRGQQAVAIAVNGAALHDVGYRYFVCGDAASPWQAWFYASQRYQARRLVASFVAPRDALLFPRRRTRLRLRLQRAPRSLAVRLGASMDLLYDYAPCAVPAAGHGWFRYAAEPFPASSGALFDSLRAGRVRHGASIGGVALQLAYVMGAASIHVYGCDMNNDAGGNYYRPGSQGRTTAEQRANFTRLIDWIAQAGVAVISPR
jgi:hypothetical protein